MNEFVRKTTAPDGIHDVVEFNEFHNSKWWDIQRRREWLLDKVAPLAALLALLGAYAIVGYMECM